MVVAALIDHVPAKGAGKRWLQGKYAHVVCLLSIRVPTTPYTNHPLIGSAVSDAKPGHEETIFCSVKIEVFAGLRHHRRQLSSIRCSRQDVQAKATPFPVSIVRDLKEIP